MPQKRFTLNSDVNVLLLRVPQIVTLRETMVRVPPNSFIPKGAKNTRRLENAG